MTIRLVFLALVAIFVGQRAQAYFVKGNDFVESMREFEAVQRKDINTDFVAASRYLSYIQAAVDVMATQRLICPNSATTPIQAGAIVAKFLNANPERWSEPAVFLVMEAVKPAFPCE